MVQHVRSARIDSGQQVRNENECESDSWLLLPRPRARLFHAGGCQGILVLLSLSPASLSDSRALPPTTNLQEAEEAELDTAISPEDIPTICAPDPWVVQLDLYEAVDVPRHKKLRLELGFGWNYLSTAPTEVNEGVVTWFAPLMHAGSANLVFPEMPNDETQCPDIFIYLCDGDDRVSQLFCCSAWFMFYLILSAVELQAIQLC